MTTPVPGGAFAGYDVVSSLGRGGMGTVYLVHNPHLDRQEALKALSMDTHGDFAARFAAEARTVAKLDHPNIVTVYHHGIDNAIPWFTMQFLPGNDLTGAGPMPVDEVSDICARVGDALDYAHRRGVIHRDIKPGNIMVSRDEAGRIDRVTVLDFGIARLAGANSNTATGTFMGTLVYSAPETVSDGAALPASDQYSLASTAYELLTGAAPFAGLTTPAMLHAQVSSPPPAIGSRYPSLSHLDPVFARALAKDPSQRYSTCSEFAAALASAGKSSTRQFTTIGPPVAPATPPSARYAAPVSAPRNIHPPRRSAATTALAVLATVLGVAVIGGVIALLVRDDGKSATPTTDPGPTVISTTTTVTETPTTAETPTGTRGQTWGLVVSPDGRVVNFKNYDDRDALLAAAASEYGYDDSWGHASFTSGCAAVAHPDSDGGKYYVELGDSRSEARSSAIDAAERDSGRSASVESVLCVGDDI